MIDTEKKLPNGWKWVKLGEVCDVISGTTPKTGISKYWNGDIVWVTPTDLGKLKTPKINNSERKITKAGFNSCNLNLITKGAVVLSSRAPIGHLAIACVDLCTNQGCKSFVADSKVIDNVFLYFTLKKSTPVLQSLGSGATFAEISKSQLFNFSIPLPPLAEQKRITTVLTAQMAAAEKAKKACQEKLEAAEKLQTSFLNAIFESENAKKWPKKKLGEVCKINPTRNPIIADMKQNVTFVPMPAVNSETGIIDKAEVKKLKDVFKGYTYFEENDVLFAKITPCMQNGKHAIARQLLNGFGFGTTEFHVIRPSEQILPEWIHSYIRQPQILHEAEKCFTGAVGQQRVPKNFLITLNIPLPLLTEQKRIVKVLTAQIAAAEKAKKAIIDEFELIDKLPVSLLKQTFERKL
ncbi:Type I restriction enzyme EcoKI specificity protein [Limihaloglobus sulfuriphilus]|uniref:Type I restriction enzyme EcoKI specificity protein n=1 Tax=Limihaloglobus sulfuriphilus TaxID=1851148 RepID=A0A1Q2MGS4_9BACT|nr:restriction endonuclease subunit S [Limihaloglobus sulfuriphilus]AQQ71854.1 Type I restriction enzyme EcoKI specificity protein [Limihaloglobus sulfuriphilus]